MDFILKADPLVTSVAERLGLRVAAAAELDLARMLAGGRDELVALVVAEDGRPLYGHRPGRLPRYGDGRMVGHARKLSGLDAP